MVFLDYDFIGIASLLDSLDSFDKAVMCVQLASFKIEIIRGYSYNQIVTKFLGTSEKIDVPLVSRSKVP